MVNKQLYKTEKDLDGGPPPLDESWWDAVLAEDEAQRKTASNRQSTPAGQRTSGRPRADLPQVDWERAKELYERDEPVCLQVTGYNRGGLLVSGEGLQGFVPVSHLVEMPGNQSEAEQEQLLVDYLNHMLQLKVIECDQERGRVVFSERAALSRVGSRNILLTRLKSGDCIVGTVTNITDFGVFVDLGGIEGLVHVSEISWGRVRHPSDVVRVGEKLEVHVISVDQTRTRVALSIKRLRPNPWETAEKRYHAGMVTEATITSIVPFGAFARLEEGLDGLIHISEICPGEKDVDAGSFLDEGQVVVVRVLHVDAAKQRLGLSLHIDPETPEAPET